jgi:ABC-type proline/glycine betaine transport system ATPase subunit
MSRIHNGSRKTLLIATHRLEEATKLCNKVVIVDEGRIKGFDCIADLTADGITLSQYYRRRLARGMRDRVVA